VYSFVNDVQTICYRNDTQLYRISAASISPRIRLNVAML
jgi:hypothetical protein